jgi:hypothetical protein
VQTLKAHALSPGGYVFDVANYKNTSRFYIDPQTAGFSVAADSGHNYKTPRRNAVEGNWAVYE